MIFMPSCTARLEPEPSTGFSPATSGVAQPQPNWPGTEGSLWLNPFGPPPGFAKLGWLKRLKTSARNWKVRRSLNFQSLYTDISTFGNILLGKMLRPAVPKVPKAGGIITEFFCAKQPPGPPAVVPLRLARAPIAVAALEQAVPKAMACADPAPKVTCLAGVD